MTLSHDFTTSRRHVLFDAVYQTDAFVSEIGDGRQRNTRTNQDRYELSSENEHSHVDIDRGRYVL